MLLVRIQLYVYSTHNLVSIVVDIINTWYFTLAMVFKYSKRIRVQTNEIASMVDILYLTQQIYLVVSYFHREICEEATLACNWTVSTFQGQQSLLREVLDVAHDTS